MTPETQTFCPERSSNATDFSELESFKITFSFG